MILSITLLAKCLDSLSTCPLCMTGSIHTSVTHKTEMANRKLLSFTKTSSDSRYCKLSRRRHQIPRCFHKSNIIQSHRKQSSKSTTMMKTIDLGDNCNESVGTLSTIDEGDAIDEETIDRPNTRHRIALALLTLIVSAVVAVLVVENIADTAPIDDGTFNVQNIGEGMEVPGFMKTNNEDQRCLKTNGKHKAEPSKEYLSDCQIYNENSCCTDETTLTAVTTTKSNIASFIWGDKCGGISE